MKDKNWERVLAYVEFAAGAACGANHSSRGNAVDFLGIRRISGRFVPATEVLSGGIIEEDSIQFVATSRGDRHCRLATSSIVQSSQTSRKRSNRNILYLLRVTWSTRFQKCREEKAPFDTPLGTNGRAFSRNFSMGYAPM